MNSMQMLPRHEANRFFSSLKCGLSVAGPVYTGYSETFSRVL